MPRPTMNRTLVPRWADHADSDFYPWLIHERPHGFDTVRALEMPEPQQPRPERWVPALTQALRVVSPGSGPRPLSPTAGRTGGRRTAG